MKKSRPTSLMATLCHVMDQSTSIVVITDTAGVIEYVNPAFCGMSGYSAEEVVGQHSRMLKSGDMAAVVYAQLWRDLMDGAGWRGEFRNRKKNGDPYWETATITPIRDRRGKTLHYMKIAEDATRQKNTERDLKASQERYERVVAATKGFMFTVILAEGRPVRTIQYPGSHLVTGYAAEEYQADPMLWYRMIEEEDRQAVRAQIEKVSVEKKVVTIEHRIRHKDGSIRWVRNVSVPTFDETGEMVSYDGLISDITDLKDAQIRQADLLNEMKRMAMRDQLTGLFSRRGFEDELKRTWQLGQRQARTMGLLVMDIDHFKVLNDTYGHTVGDAVIIEAAQLILTTVRAIDVVSRCGGDEIVVILPLAGNDEIRKASDRLLDAFRAHTFCEGVHDLQVTISIGAACGTTSTETPQTTLRHADQALYRAKRSGRNMVRFWDDEASADLVQSEVEPSRTSVRAEVANGRDAGKGVVLVVDDEPSVCTALRTILEGDGYVVATSLNGVGARQIMEKMRGGIDVALMDLNLVAEDGLTVLRQLREIDDTMAGVVVTGQVTATSVVDSLRSGASDFVEKPFSATTISGAVERAMRYRRLLQENVRYQRHLEEMVAERSFALSRTLNQVKESYTSTLEALASILDLREKPSSEHSRRVSKMINVLAQEMGFSGKVVDTFVHGALLHDIGKIAIPDSILLKPVPLTEEEWAIVREHSKIGHDIVSACPAFEAVSDIVFSHQEHYDGSGYPRGLKGSEICIGARLFSVLDAYDAMRSSRPYCAPISPEEARAEIVACSGAQFDPDVVEAFLRCHNGIEECMQMHSGAPPPAMEIVTASLKKEKSHAASGGLHGGN